MIYFFAEGCCNKKNSILSKNNPIRRGDSSFFVYLHAFLMEKMRKLVVFLMLCCLGLAGCRQGSDNAELLHRSFYDCRWERFDAVKGEVEVKEMTTFDLSMKISFTEDYPYDRFSMVFTVFTQDDEPYRCKGYKFNLKDTDGQWQSELKDGCYTFDLPINKSLTIVEPGAYRFQIENQMPITPLVGVKELTLKNNLKMNK